MTLRSEVVICGAGIAGISTAYHLAVQHGLRDVVIVDERPPLSLTSDKSTECYRNWWPGPDDAMVQLMNRSIDRLENLASESGNVFGMNRRGYVYATAEPAQVDEYRLAAQQAASFGAGPFRVHDGGGNGGHYQPAQAEGFDPHLTGADLILDRELIQEHFPYLSDEVLAVLHIRRAGWLSAQQLGMYLFQRALQAGVSLIQERVEGVEVRGNRVRTVRLGNGEQLATSVFVNAAGPYLNEVGAMLGVDLPVRSELHLKASISDHLGILPRDIPMIIWGDRQRLDWSPQEQAWLQEDDALHWLLESLPAGAHTRPDGGADSQILLLLWEYNRYDGELIFPPPMDPFFPEIALRGLVKMVPGMRAYLDRLPKPTSDGGYYTKTQENRPLSGPLPVEGAFVLGALSGFGIMASPGLGELLAAHITASPLPAYASAFSFERYEDPDYQQKVSLWGDTWQL